jgi:hypothetical protein
MDCVCSLSTTCMMYASVALRYATWHADMHITNLFPLILNDHDCRTCMRSRQTQHTSINESTSPRDLRETLLACMHALPEKSPQRYVYIWKSLLMIHAYARTARRCRVGSSNRISCISWDISWFDLRYTGSLWSSPGAGASDMKLLIGRESYNFAGYFSCFRGDLFPWRNFPDYFLTFSISNICLIFFLNLRPSTDLRPYVTAFSCV